MMTRPARSGLRKRGITLVEIVMVVVVMSIAAGLVMISTESFGPQYLQEAAAVLSGDLMLARDAAFTSGADYTVTFDLVQNAYSVAYSGSGSPPPLERPLSNGSPGSFTVSLAGLHPGGSSGAPVTLYRVRTAVSQQDVGTVVFNSRGSTGPARSEDTLIWLARQSGAETRYLKITINWLTGQVWTSEPLTSP